MRVCVCFPVRKKVRGCGCVCVSVCVCVCVDEGVCIASVGGAECQVVQEGLNPKS